MMKISPNTRYAAIQGSFWAAYAVIWAYIAILLLDFGFSNRQIGLITALATLLSVYVAPQLSAAIDRSRRLFSWHGAVITMGTSFLCTVLIMLLPRNPGSLGTALLFVALGTALASASPFLNAMAMEANQVGIPVVFGFCRGIGSICYALASLALGFHLKSYGTFAILPGYACISILFLLFLLWYSEPGQKKAPPATQQVTGMLALLRSHPRFSLTLLGCVLFFASHTIGNVYAYEVVGRVGGDASSIGILLAISATVELPAMTMVSRLRGRLSCRTLLRVCGLANTAKFLLFLLAPSIGVIYCGSVVQFFQFGFYMPATVYYVNEVIEPANQVKGQAAIHVAGCGLGSALGSLCGGYVLDAFGIEATMLLAVGSAALGAVVFFLSTAEKK